MVKISLYSYQAVVISKKALCGTFFYITNVASSLQLSKKRTSKTFETHSKILEFLKPGRGNFLPCGQSFALSCQAEDRKAKMMKMK